MHQPKILGTPWRWGLLGAMTLAVVLGPNPSAAAPQAGSTLYLPLVLRNSPNGSQSGQWTQEAHDAQRTGYTTIDPLTPWTFLWTFNGPNSSGGVSCNNNPTQGHCYDAPRQAYTVAGGSAIYAPAGNQGVYALAQSDGHVQWNARPASVSFNATPAYDPLTGFVFAGGSDGRLYKFNTSNGSYTNYNAGNAINRGILLVGSYAYAVTDNARLHKVSTSALTAAWVYTATGATTTGTGLAYSASRDAILFATEDLFVHAVNNNNGTQKWRVKPSPNTAGSPNEWLWYWPVIAEQHGVVFLRMRLDHNTGLWGYPSAKNIWPNSNLAAQTYLSTTTPSQQNLFALNLDTGAKKFIPAVGYGGVEDLKPAGFNGISCSGQPMCPFLTTGPVPVVKVWANGDEVAYIHFRNGQALNATYSDHDGRKDSHMGEMVLDNTTIANYAAGYMRFVLMACNVSASDPNIGCGFTGPTYRRSYTHITDEQGALSMAGNTIFHAHWGASESARITDRSDALGLSYSNPIQSTSNPAVLRRVAPCGGLSPTAAHYISACGLNAYGDSRYWPNPGFWTYWNTWDPPTTSAAASAYSDGMRPRYTYVTGNLIVVEGNGGELMVFRHSGTVTP